MERIKSNGRHGCRPDTSKKGNETMTNKEAYKLIGERAEELTKEPNIRKQMIEIARKEGKEKAEQFLYFTAIATLVGI